MPQHFGNSSAGMHEYRNAFIVRKPAYIRHSMLLCHRRTRKSINDATCGETNRLCRILHSLSAFLKDCCSFANAPSAETHALPYVYALMRMRMLLNPAQNGCEGLDACRCANAPLFDPKAPPYAYNLTSTRRCLHFVGMFVEPCGLKRAS